MDQCWRWSSNTLATWCKELTPWKRPWCWQRLRAGGNGTTELEMVGWHHQLDGHEFEQTLGDSEGQGSLLCCGPWGHKKEDPTERLNNSHLRGSSSSCWPYFLSHCISSLLKHHLAIDLLWLYRRYYLCTREVLLLFIFLHSTCITTWCSTYAFVYFFFLFSTSWLECKL